MMKNLLMWLVIGLVLFTVFQNFSSTTATNELSYTDFVHEVQNDRVAQVVIEGQMIRGLRTDNTPFTVVRPELFDSKLVDDLLSHNVAIKGTEPRRPSNYWLLVFPF